MSTGFMYVCACARVCMCVITDAGSVVQSHLTREERVKDAAEREGKKEVKRKGGGVLVERERARRSRQRAECQAAWY